MLSSSVTKYAIQKVGTGPTILPTFLARSGTKNEWVWDIFKATQFHSDPFQFPEIRKIIDRGEGEIVTVRITAEINPQEN